MPINKIKCEAIEVRTESGICPGLAKTVQGETTILDPRTKGMCTNALMAVYPMSLAMKLTDKMDWEIEQKREHFDLVCPHGSVTFRISRKKEN